MAIKLETTEIEELKFDYDEKYRPFVWLAGLLEIGWIYRFYKSFI
jgi:Ca-activated chloride channel family protein